MPIYSIGSRQPELHAECWIADNAVVIGSVVVHKNASIWFHTVVRGDNDIITIGENCNIQDGSVLHTDPGIHLSIGADVTVGHQVMLHGCIIGEGSLIGIKSVILNHAVIGRDCLIGANSLIPEGREIPARSLVMGSPGKVIRQLTDDEVARLGRAAQGYVNNWQRYRRELRPYLTTQEPRP